MNTILECASLYESLLYKEFILTLENGTVINIIFEKRNFYHLLGLHKLYDIDVLKGNKIQIYNKIFNEIITDKHIKKSSFYNKIENRVKYFDIVPELLNSKIIIDFDPMLLGNTELKNTKYILYRKHQFGYSHLTIGNKNGKLYPETFIVENSKRYINGQTLLDIIHVKVVDFKPNGIDQINAWLL